MKTHYDNQILHALRGFMPVKKTASTTINDAKIYELLLGKQMDEKISAERRMEVQKICNIYLSGVVQCRKKAVAESVKFFAEADRQFNLINNTQQIAIINLYRLSGWAYYYFCTGNHELAEENLLQGLAKSAVLESEGLSLLIYRRIEQVINLINIYFTQKAFTKAVNTCRHLSFILLKGTHCDAFGGNWDNGKLDAEPYFKELMLNTVFKLIIRKNLELKSSKKYGDLYFYNHIYAHLSSFSVDTYNKFVISQWLNIKNKAIVSGSNNSYQKEAIDFLINQQISADYDAFKASVLVQVLANSSYLNAFGFIDTTVKAYVGKLALSNTEKLLLLN